MYFSSSTILSWSVSSVSADQKVLLSKIPKLWYCCCQQSMNLPQAVCSDGLQTLSVTGAAGLEPLGSQQQGCSYASVLAQLRSTLLQSCSIICNFFALIHAEAQELCSVWTKLNLRMHFWRCSSNSPQLELICNSHLLPQNAYRVGAKTSAFCFLNAIPKSCRSVQMCYYYSC